MTRNLFTTGATLALTALAASLSVTGTASADIDDVMVTGPTDNSQCDIDTGCLIRTTLVGANKLAPVEFLVDGTVIGSATPTPVPFSTNAQASFAWHPPEYRSYTVGIRQSGSLSTILYNVHKPGTCAWLPSGSGTGSAGTGSFGSGSAGTGSAGTGSSNTGSGGTGSC
ncbi:hypothetical protein [Nocardia jejuensis]|uniref:hypothetical protein n=1 Tax=Nocardia jejuensis TaxID=328049 RepID=UPI00082EB4D7|nr:hypothetical protein [Nocardia jejuensis]